MKNAAVIFAGILNKKPFERKVNFPICWEFGIRPVDTGKPGPDHNIRAKVVVKKLKEYLTKEMGGVKVLEMKDIKITVSFDDKISDNIYLKSFADVYLQEVIRDVGMEELIKA